MHDRLADSYVKGIGKTGGSPTLVERLWVRLAYVIVLANVAVIILAQVLYFRDEVQSLSEFITQPEYLCDEVSLAKESWPKSEKVSRLDIALTLYGADAANEECLEIEAQRAIAYGEELPKAYLAKAFAFESETDISNMYLEKICTIDKKGEPCLLTKVIKFWADKDWKSADQLLKGKDFKSAFVKVWIIKHYDKIQKYDELISLAEGLWPNKSLNDFIGRYKTLTLWKTDKINESKELFQNTYAYLPEEQKISFLSDICNLEIEKSCSPSSLKACTLLVNRMKSYAESEFLEEEALLTYIKTNKCGITEIDDIISELRAQVDDPKIQMYLAAVRAQSQGKKSVAQQIYKSILKTTSESSSLSYEVRGNLVETLSKEDFSDQIKWWLSADVKSFYHQNLGVKILKALSDKKEWKMAEPIAQKLMANHSYLLKEQSEIMAIVFYNLKKYNVAKKIIQSMEQKNTRNIASQSEFSSIKNKLMNSSVLNSRDEGEK